MKKIDFRKGTGTFLMGYMIMLLGFIVSLVCIEQMKRYNNSLETQMTADSASDGVAVYMAANDGDYNDAYARAEEIASLYNQNTDVEITNINLDREVFDNDDRARITVTSIFGETSNVDDVYATNGNNSNYYLLSRLSETKFTRGNSGLLWPVSSIGTITSRFGRRESPGGIGSTYHQGLDIACPTGTPILASKSGVVEAAGYSSAMGNYVYIRHNESMRTVYMHNSELRVIAGDRVESGQVIALSGNTGNSTGPHCHFGVEINGQFVDPWSYLQIPSSIQ